MALDVHFKLGGAVVKGDCKGGALITAAIEDEELWEAHPSQGVGKAFFILLASPAKEKGESCF